MNIAENPASFQQQSRHQRVSASASISFHHRDTQTRLDTLYQQGSAKIRFPKNYDDQLEAVLINTAGGLTGGDQIDWDLHLKPNSNVVVTTQACEKAYKASADSAHVTTTMRLDQNSVLHWLPQETILYDRSSLKRRFDVELEASATLFAVECLQLGRDAMGETIEHLTFHDRWRIEQDGKLIFADDLRLSDHEASNAKLGNNHALASLVLISPLDTEQLNGLAEKLREICPAEMSGFSVSGSRLTGRILAQDSYLLRQALTPILKEIRGRELPRVWRI
ncbi:MAG: urease accessory protein UreD [Hyphomicrobiales bacterium]